MLDWEPVLMKLRTEVDFLTGRPWSWRCLLSASPYRLLQTSLPKLAYFTNNYHVASLTTALFVSNLFPIL